MCIILKSIHIEVPAMRTNIDIDDALLDEARRATGLRTKKETVEEGLRVLVRLKEQEEILGLAGKVRWEGDLDRSRRGRNAG
jgi:Arc/MetJ family transcription regulator